MNRSMLRPVHRTIAGAIALAAATLFPGIGAFAQTIPAPAPLTDPQPNLQPVSPPSPPLPNRSTGTPGFSQEQTQPAPQPLTQEPTLACPAGQFASKFPDVTPNDWAYEAVNRVASGEFRCFPTQS